MLYFFLFSDMNNTYSSSNSAVCNFSLSDSDNDKTLETARIAGPQSRLLDDEERVFEKHLCESGTEL